MMAAFRNTDPAMATEDSVAEKPPEAEKDEKKKPEPKDQITVTRHRVKAGGRELAYTVTCGTMVLHEEAEKEGKSEGKKARAEGRVQDLRFTLKEGPRFRIRSIDVAGNVVTRDKVILREFAVYPGEPLDSNAIAKGVRRVRDTGTTLD